jgi:hypothetical protein
VANEEALKRAAAAIRAELGEADGFSWEDIPDVVRVGTEVVETIGGMTGEQKKAAVLATIRPIYEEKLKGLLDKHDMPWVPAALERSIVDPMLLQTSLWAFDQIVPSLIDLVVDASKGKLNLNKLLPGNDPQTP